MGFHNIDAPGNAVNRRGVRAIQRAHDSSERQSAAQARRNAKRAKRASASAILFYPWPVDGVMVEDREGAYAQGPNGDGQYQVVIIGALKGSHDDYCAAVSKWVGLKLRVLETSFLKGPTDESRQGHRRDPGLPIAQLQELYRTRGPFLSIILEPDAPDTATEGTIP